MPISVRIHVTSPVKVGDLMPGEVFTLVEDIEDGQELVGTFLVVDCAPSEGFTLDDIDGFTKEHDVLCCAMPEGHLMAIANDTRVRPWPLSELHLYGREGDRPA